jgi:hypothetical protein
MDTVAIKVKDYEYFSAIRFYEFEWQHTSYGMGQERKKR